MRHGMVRLIMPDRPETGQVSSPDGPALVAQMLTEVHRLLADDGLFISFSGSDPNDENEAKNGMNVLEEIVLPPLIEAAEESVSPPPPPPALRAARASSSPKHTRRLSTRVIATDFGPVQGYAGARDI